MRLKILWAFITFLCAILLIGLWNIQLRCGQKYFLLAEDNRIKLIPIDAPRGIIYDTQKNPLVDNRPCFSVQFIPSELKKHPKAVSTIAEILNLDVSYVWDKIKKNRPMGFSSIELKKEITRQQVAAIEERSLDLPGIYVSVDTVRQYLQGNFLSHVIGYIGQMNKKEYELLSQDGYLLGDMIGKFGIEKSYDKYLQGQKGGKQIEISASGMYKRLLSEKEPIKGNDVILTIDSKIQKVVEEVFQEEKGSVIIMDPNNGDVLAMVSKPSFDPNIFVDSEKKEELLKFLDDRKNKIGINRAIGGLYSPGSIFKIIVGLAALQEGVADSKTYFDCKGFMEIAGRKFHCWEEKGHGLQNIVSALKNSCNVYFFNVGLKLGVDKISQYASMFGLGQKTGIELSGEQAGLVPSQSWKRQFLKSKWYSGETANFSIGQGYVLVTPIQLAVVVSAIANGGTLYQPALVRGIVDSTTGEILEPFPNHKKDLKLDPWALSVIKDGMKEVVNDLGGSGAKAKIDNITVCGKTGTVQVVGRERKEQLGGGVATRNHAWFVCFAPDKKPLLSMVVFVEHGESGAKKAAVVAHDILIKVLPMFTAG